MFVAFNVDVSMASQAWKGFAHLLEEHQIYCTFHLERAMVTQQWPQQGAGGNPQYQTPQEGAAGRERFTEIRLHNWREVGTFLGCLAFSDFPLVD